MMPNETYETMKTYFEQNQYSAEREIDVYQAMPLLRLPEGWYFEKLRSDVRLLEHALKPQQAYDSKPISEQIFGNEIKQQYVGLKHVSNLFSERSQLHKSHIREIDKRHIEAQERLFGVQINSSSDRGKRLSNIEGQLSQLEKERREEELAFWRDTVDLREKLFEGAGNYRDAKHRGTMFSDVEVDYGR